MTQIQRNASGFTKERRPPILPEHVEGDATVVTIAEAHTPKVSGVQKVVLYYNEFPSHAHWMNATMVDYLVAKLGGETDTWIGQRVPLEKIMVDNPTTGEPVQRLYVMPPREWGDAFAQFDGPAKRTVAKRGRK